MYARYRTHTSINDKKMITTRKKKTILLEYLKI